MTVFDAGTGLNSEQCTPYVECKTRVANDVVRDGPAQFNTKSGGENPALDDVLSPTASIETFEEYVL